VERSRATAGPGGRILEDLFHLMVVISIQTTDLLGFLGALQLSANISVLRNRGSQCPAHYRSTVDPLTSQTGDVSTRTDSATALFAFSGGVFFDVLDPLDSGFLRAEYLRLSLRKETTDDSFHCVVLLRERSDAVRDAGIKGRD
jgi:hypothetical protein